jgi:P27 family predicted phage terminase small subunit
MANPRKPSAQRKREGNPGKRAIPQDVVIGKTGKAPPMPRYLKGHAATTWKFLVKELVAAGVIATVDRDMIAQFCIASQVARKAYEQMNDRVAVEGSRGMVKDPAITAWKEATAEMRQLANHFGLSPSARSSLGAGGGAQSDPTQLNPAIGASPRLKAVRGGKA